MVGCSSWEYMWTREKLTKFGLDAKYISDKKNYVHIACFQLCKNT